jgi:hypothetical protein
VSDYRYPDDDWSTVSTCKPELFFTDAGKKKKSVLYHSLRRPALEMDPTGYANGLPVIVKDAQMMLFV